MKRSLQICSLAIFLTGMLVLLCACGAQSQTANVSASSPASVSSSTDGSLGEVEAVPEWVEDALDLSALAADTRSYSGVALSGTVSFAGGYLLEQSTQDTETTLNWYAPAGEPLCSLVLTLDEDCYLFYSSFSDDNVYCVIWQVEETDSETGSTTGNYRLEKWSADGTQLWSLPIDESTGFSEELAEGEAVSIQDCAAYGDSLLLLSENMLYWLDADGKVTGSTPTGTVGGALCVGSSGAVYFADNYSVYPVDCTELSIGEALFTLSNSENVLTGQNGYELLLCSGSKLRGVSLETHTITQLLSWEACNLSGSVNAAMCLGENDYLVNALTDLNGNYQLLELRFLPTDEVPERTTITLAIPGKADADWTAELSTDIVYAINAFNLASAEYHLEVVFYPSEQDLQLKMVSGEMPDLIGFNGSLEDMPSEQLYAKRGYLADLETLLAQDEELSVDDFLPNVLQSIRNSDGGLYAMPLSFMLSTVAIDGQYWDESCGWTASGLLAAAQKMPEGMSLYSNSGAGTLESLIRDFIGEFVDISSGTCDFQQREFYDLLTLCGSYCRENAASQLLSSKVILSPRSFAEGAVTDYANGLLYAGFLDAAAPMTVLQYNTWAITAYGNQEGAWAFLRTLLTSQAQASAYLPVRRDALDSCFDTARNVMTQDAKDPQDETLLAQLAALDEAYTLVTTATTRRQYDFPVASIVLEEAAAYFAGDKSAQDVAAIIQNRVQLYLDERS